MNTTKLSSSLLNISRRSVFSIRSCRQFSNARYITSPPTQLPRAFPLHAQYPNKPRYYATMTALKPGDKFPSGVTFSYIPYSKETEDFKTCGRPQEYDASKNWADKKVVLFSVPGAFTPTCSANHLPGYIEKLPELKKKGVDIVAVLAYNDPWVMSAWAKANKVTNDDIIFLSDPEAKFSTSIGWNAGERTARYAMIIDHGKITYAEKESGGGVSVSGVDAVLSKL